MFALLQVAKPSENKTVQETVGADFERKLKTVQETMDAGFERMDAGLERMDAGLERMNAGLERMDACFWMLEYLIVQNYAVRGNVQPATINISKVKHFQHSHSGKNIVYNKPQQMAAEPYISIIKRMADCLTNVAAYLPAQDSKAAELLSTAKELILTATNMFSDYHSKNDSGEPNFTEQQLDSQDCIHADDITLIMTDNGNRTITKDFLEHPVNELDTDSEAAHDSSNSDHVDDIDDGGRILFNAAKSTGTAIFSANTQSIKGFDTKGFAVAKKPLPPDTRGDHPPPLVDSFGTHKSSFVLNASPTTTTALEPRENVMCGPDGLGKVTFEAVRNKKRSARRQKVKADWREEVPTDKAMSEEWVQTAVKEQDSREDDFKRFRSNRAGQKPLIQLADASRNGWLWPALSEQTQTRQLGLHHTDYNEEENDFKIRILQQFAGVHDKENDGHTVRIFKTEPKNGNVLRRKAPDGAVCPIEEVVVGDVKARSGSWDGLKETNYSN